MSKEPITFEQSYVVLKTRGEPQATPRAYLSTAAASWSRSCLTGNVSHGSSNAAGAEAHALGDFVGIETLSEKGLNLLADGRLTLFVQLAEGSGVRHWVSPFLLPTFETSLSQNLAVVSIISITYTSLYRFCKIISKIYTLCVNDRINDTLTGSRKAVIVLSMFLK